MYLLDTNVLSGLIRKQADPLLLSSLRQHAADPLFTSCICVMELRYGATRRDDGGVLWRRIERDILPRVQILNISVEDALLAGDIMAGLSAIGRPIDVEDILIGASAISHGLTVVTNNLAHFRRIPGLSIEDWTTRRDRN